MSENKGRTIRLFCPSVPGTARLLVAQGEQRVDLGSIARTFGLNTSTVKLNGHFNARGADLVASSVTWKTLLSFFSAKGLSTGENGARPLVVDGKLCKVGNKRRGYDTQDSAVKTTGYVTEDEDNKLLNSKKTRATDLGCGLPKYTGICSERKQLLEDLNLLKKLRINETDPDDQGRSRDLSNTISSKKPQFRCSYKRVKRMREDETVLVSPCKKLR